MTSPEHEEEVHELRRHLEEAEETLRAIRSGEVDGLVVNGPEGDRVYTLQGADHPYRALIEAMQQGAASLSGDGTVLFCNRCFANMVKKPHEKVIGATVFDFLPASQRTSFDTMLRHGRTTGNQQELQLQAGDGALLPVFVALAPLVLSDTVTLCMVVTDLTEMKKHQELQQANQQKDQALARLRASEERFRRFMDNSPVIAWAKDEQGRYVYLNRAYQERFGVRLEDWRGKTDFDVWPIEIARQFWQDDQAVLITGQPNESIDEVVEAHGRRRLWRNWKFRYEDAETKRYVGGIGWDVTDQKRAEDALKDADRRKDEFLATLAHELRNPLAPIRNALQIIQMSADRQAREQARAMMERQLTQLVRLVDDLMDVNRIRKGRIELRKDRVQLAAVINSAVETSRPLIEQMAHRLTVTLPRQPIVVDADLTRLAQVFLNLLNNAAKYSDRGGHIRLSAERHGSEVRVSVRDTGIGIPADKLTSIFQMFSQVDRALERSQGGLGIGLSLVKGLVEMHGGTIEARSEGPGKGSEFIVRLPVVIEASHPQPAGQLNESTPQFSLRILIVDDNRDGADSLAMMLRIMGNDTRTANDGQQGVEAAGAFRPDVVLLDIGLPRLNGYEACRRIREQPWGKNIIIVAVTGWGQEEDRRRSHEAGFDYHVVKPVDPQALMKLLAELQPMKG